MSKGYLALILHAHLPFVRHPEYQSGLEEHWLFEAITETYVPLLLMMESLVSDGVDFRLTFSITPTLSTMLSDPLLQQRYTRRLDALLELSKKEIDRTKGDPHFNALAYFYHDRLLTAFRRFQETGHVEILASAATHAYLPLLSTTEAAVRAQIRVGISHYRHTFGRDPKGFWLPECGYYPGVDMVLVEEGIQYTILESHGITRGQPRPRHGVYTPVYCPSGLAVVGRDPGSAQQVWSSSTGYPGDYEYREFYRDIGHDLDLDYIGPYIHPDGIRIDTGIKYYRITGPGHHKEPYSPACAIHKSQLHAADFLSKKQHDIERLAFLMGRRPILAAPYDAELFGHWWFEGPVWLEHLIRLADATRTTVALRTISEYLEEYPVNQVVQPSASSWGFNGYHEVWLNGNTDWIYPHLDHGAAQIERLARAAQPKTYMLRRALNQAVRELFLAQSSDWAFMISGKASRYASSRTTTHLIRLNKLLEAIKTDNIDCGWLRTIEDMDNIFPNLDYTSFI